MADFLIRWLRSEPCVQSRHEETHPPHFWNDWGTIVYVVDSAGEVNDEYGDLRTDPIRKHCKGVKRR